MTARARRYPPRGIDILLRPERVEAALWRTHSTAPNQDTRRDLFDHYRTFAAKLASWQFTRRGGNYEKEDLEQLAYEALLQAIERFEPDRGVPFEAYARIRINGHIANGLGQASEAAAQFRYRLRTERERLRSLRPAKDVAAADPFAALSALSASIALGLMLEIDATPALESIPDPAPSAYESLAWNELLHGLHEQVDLLPEREAYVIRQHYHAGVSFQQIALVLGLTKGRISQIHRSGLDRLRSRIARLR